MDHIARRNHYRRLRTKRCLPQAEVIAQGGRGLDGIDVVDDFGHDHHDTAPPNDHEHADYDYEDEDVEVALPDYNWLCYYVNI